MKERHILSLSGGKDSAALAVYMREEYPHLPLEYLFIDSGCELPETYAYLDRLEAILGIEIIKIGAKERSDRKDFLWWLKRKNYYLPTPKNRWCTEVLKLIPYFEWINNECHGMQVYNYVGLRFDEKRERTGFQKNDTRILSIFPFVEDGLVYEDVERILLDSGIGFPDYYQWRSRSGCYFCFFQTKREWIGLLRNHPDLYDAAANMEKLNEEEGCCFTWNEGFSLAELKKTANQELKEEDVEVFSEKPHSDRLVCVLANVLHEDKL